ncbi:hypothetical protein JYU34_003533 [Plutella xylostella]|uniref:Uncharacterized protein n=1 Tax=Plutella xylostella TaxID=51655 RepID=A0ABQ7R0A4_PLUXY|nr:hypothetical protein JYU34_003533 [Plutella xylostella]
MSSLYSFVNATRTLFVNVSVNNTKQTFYFINNISFIITYIPYFLHIILIMGIVNSKEPRRISFDNTLSVNPTLVVNPSVAVENSITEQPETNVFQLPHIEHTENIFHDVPPKSPLKNIGSPESDVDYKYWANRVEGLKKEHQIIKGIIESEFINTLKTTNEICPPQVITQEKIQKVKPCVDWRFKVDDQML